MLAKTLNLLLAMTLLAAACSPAPAEEVAPPTDTTFALDDTESEPLPEPEPPQEPQEVVIEAPSSLAFPLAEDPVLPPAAGERFVNPGAMVEHNGHIQVFANSFSRFPGPSVVHRWTSQDGLEWALASEDPLLTTDDVPYTEGNVFLYSVDVTAEGWVGWFYTYEGATQPGVIGRVTAPGPEGPWTVDTEPVLLPGDDADWDGVRLTEPSVVRDGDRYLMLYGGRDSSGTSAIGLATSSDGIDWTKHDGPVLVGDGVWDADTVARPRAIPHGEGWLLLYAAAARGTGSVGVATSRDGIDWTRYPNNPILTPGDLAGSLFQYGLIPYQGRLLWLFEAGGGTTRTDLYALELLAPDTGPLMEVVASISADTVEVRVAADGIELRFDPADTSGATAHPHVFLNSPPPLPGEEVPLSDPTIVHARGDTVTVRGLERGRHTLWIALADGEDRVLVPPAPVRIEVNID